MDHRGNPLTFFEWEVREDRVFLLVKKPPAIRETWVRSLGWEDPLEKGKAGEFFWPGEFQGLYSPLGRKESNTNE